MTSDDKHNDSIEPGTYLIRCVALSSPLNLIRHSEDQRPSVTNWKTINSPTERWAVERGKQGYRLKNASAGVYLSIESDTPGSHDRVVGLQRPDEWKIEETENAVYHVRHVSHPQHLLDFCFHNDGDSNGNNRGELIICTDCHGHSNQQWAFQKVDEELPPSYIRRPYIGPVPSGIYWLGQPHEENRTRSVAAITAITGLPLEEEERAYAHLTAIGNGPSPQQIWSLESGRHGYRLKNVGANAYLNYLHSELVLESAALGPFSVTEWSLCKDPTQDSNDRPDYCVRPSSELNVAIGVKNGDSFNQVRAWTFDRWNSEEEEIVYRWRFESVEAKFWDAYQRQQ